MLLRNQRCWCGSTKKYKHCHYDHDDKLKHLQNAGYSIPYRSLIRNNTEIQHIRESAKITTEILDILGEKLHVGMKTDDIDKIVYDTTTRFNAIPAPLGYNGFTKSCCTSINNVICHGIPDETIINDGDIINIDITTNLNNFYSDASRMYLIGNVKESARKLVDVAKECLFKGIEAIEPFKPITVIGDAIEPLANLHNYSVVQDLGGHGIGLEFHTEPHVHHFIIEEKGMIMVPNMIFTVEPMINEGTYHAEFLDDGWTVITKDGLLSAQWEHTILVTEDGYEILT